MPWLNIDDAFNDARRDGHFDNLPGSGKPLAWGDLEALEGDSWAANRLLKSNNFAPEPIERRREITLALAQATRAIERAWAFTSRSRRAGYDALVEQRWQKSRRLFVDSIATINKSIRDLNLSTDVAALHMQQLNAEAMLADVMSVTHNG